MALEVYKMEVGTSISVRVNTWAFYWELSNSSGREPDKIAWDIALSLEGFLNWFSQFRDFWPAGNYCHKYRIQRVWPAFSPWFDYYWYFRDHGGRFAGAAATNVVKTRIKWFTSRWEINGACTYLNQWPNGAFDKNLLVGDALAASESWAKLHLGPHVTAYGDTFRPCILDMFGNYNTILNYWVDPRPIGSRAHTSKG